MLSSAVVVDRDITGPLIKRASYSPTPFFFASQF